MDVEETFPNQLVGAEIAEYLADLKSGAFINGLADNEILITSDTIVWLGDRVFNKPQDTEEAKRMIATLSERSHEVITAVCICSKEHKTLFHDLTTVTFGKISDADIEQYVDKFLPMDKAGAYGIQEWIGYVGIEKIEGSFYNVMGFPTHKFYKALQNFLKQ